jgi:wyosine [tRNA(Phe)-imidazoG37] synthetase (radical SAM superfamily)
MIAFGPVPSRRLGNSLGLNNIPHKSCPYSCVYCQIGRTRRFDTERISFYEPEAIHAEAETRIQNAVDEGETIDYLTFVPDGEPTLDCNLGRTIDLLKPFGVKIAVISNASLIWNADVRKELLKADWVSLKFDTVIEKIWKKVNRPKSTLRLSAIKEGALAFASAFTGTLVTETMLVAGVNDDAESLGATADFIRRLNPSTAYLSVPIRPPAEEWAKPPSEAVLARAYELFSRRMDHVELIIEYEGNAFSSTGDIEHDLLSITAVHPMRADAVAALLETTHADWSVVDDLVEQRLLAEVVYGEHTFYVRQFSR